MEPKVAIIIPAYHAAQTITRCLDSIHAQTYTNYKVLVVIDDVEYDNTDQLIMEHPLHEEGKIGIVRNTTKTSPAKARNLGVQFVLGVYDDPDYIAFCDADDWWEPTKLALQIVVLLHSGKDVCYTLSEWHYANGRREIHGVPWGKFPLWLVCVAPHSSVVVTAEMARCVPFDVRLKAADDYRWLLDLQKHGATFVSVNMVLSYMGVDGNNLTTGTGMPFVFQTMRVHGVANEYHLMVFKMFMGIGLYIKRAVFRKLNWTARGLTA